MNANSKKTGLSSFETIMGGFRLLFCGTNNAPLSEINTPVLISAARFLRKTSVRLDVQ